MKNPIQNNPLVKRTRPLDAKITPVETPARDGFDPGTITDTIQRALASAGLGTGSGPMRGMTDTIRRALSGTGVDVPHATRQATPPARRTAGRPAREARAALSGTFESHTHTDSCGTRSYRLYIPSGYRAANDPAPLVVMLHGCTQSPEDFAAGTRMNALAERHGFLVAYPGQTANANGSKCWNWFRTEDQQRDRGEPALIAGITRDIMGRHRIDAGRVFVAGLSAGAAMAVILGETYPDLYAAVGAHSGLAYAAASDMPSAFGAMRGGGAASPRTPSGPRVPTIVFHGDNDQTVNIGNGVAIGRHAFAPRTGEAGLRSRTETGTAPDGRTHLRTVHVDAAGRVVVEEWRLHGAGHAWSGGSPDGSFTDTRGPDASAEMVRFFLQLHLRAA